MSTTEATYVIPEKRQLTTKPRFSDKVFRGVVTGGGLSSLVILGLIFAFLLYQGFDIFKSQGFDFITTSRWDISLDESGNSFRQVANFVGFLEQFLGNGYVGHELKPSTFKIGCKD